MARASSRTPAKRQSMSTRCSTAQVNQAGNQTADEVRAGDQPEEPRRWAHNPTIDPRPRGRGQRMSHPLPVFCQGSKVSPAITSTRNEGPALQMKLPPTPPSKPCVPAFTGRRRLEPDFFLCGLELRPEFFEILEGQGRAFRVSRPWALVHEG